MAFKHFWNSCDTKWCQIFCELFQKFDQIIVSVDKEFPPPKKETKDSLTEILLKINRKLVK